MRSSNSFMTNQWIGPAHSGYRGNESVVKNNYKDFRLLGSYEWFLGLKFEDVVKFMSSLSVDYVAPEEAEIESLSNSVCLHKHIEENGLTSAAKRLGKSISTVQSWVNSGKVYKLKANESGELEAWERK